MLSYEPYGTNTDDDRLQGLFLHVILKERFFWVMIPINTWTFVEIFLLCEGYKNTSS